MISSIYNNQYALWKTGDRKGKTREEILREQKLRLKKKLKRKNIEYKQNLVC
jgi:hypothetical protein